MADQPTLTATDTFAELLSEGLTILQVRKRMGLTDGAAQVHMNKIRAGLGWQCA